jgi:hypothetical protein
MYQIDRLKKLYYMYSWYGGDRAGLVAYSKMDALILVNLYSLYHGYSVRHVAAFCHAVSTSAEVLAEITTSDAACSKCC